MNFITKLLSKLLPNVLGDYTLGTKVREEYKKTKKLRGEYDKKITDIQKLISKAIADSDSVELSKLRTSLADHICARRNTIGKFGNSVYNFCGGDGKNN